MGGKPPLARVYVHDADLGDGGGECEAGMPVDDFNDPYARKAAILRGLGLHAGARAPEGYPNAQLVTGPVPRTRVNTSGRSPNNRARGPVNSSGILPVASDAPVKNVRGKAFLGRDERLVEGLETR